MLLKGVIRGAHQAPRFCQTVVHSLAALRVSRYPESVGCRPALSSGGRPRLSLERASKPAVVAWNGM
jgi:hypothetical protein